MNEGNYGWNWGKEEGVNCLLLFYSIGNCSDMIICIAQFAYAFISFG